MFECVCERPAENRPGDRTQLRPHERFPVPSTSFADLGLPAPLLSATAELGFTTPTAIQEQAVPALLAGRDVTGVAQTGTGKTAAFGLPLLAAVDPAARHVQAVVLAPTRELALQVAEAITSFARHLPDVEVLPVYGGAPYPPQLRALARGAQVVVGTPGRVVDLVRRGALDLARVRFLVLDEADEMLRMGFAEDVETVLAAASGPRQVALFSATMPAQIRRVAQRHLEAPVEIAVTRPATTVSAVRQTYAVVPFRHKAGALARVLATSEAEAAIVFTRTRGSAEQVGAALVERGVAAATISGDVAQKDRERIVERLRAGQVDVLVATDVAARGLDVERVGLVVNYDIPGEPETYVHRIGRTGRAGRTGEAITFVTPAERSRLRGIERAVRTELELVEVPSPAEVSAHRARRLLAQVPARTEAGRLDLYRELLAGAGDPLEVAAALLALAVGDDGPRARAEQEQFETERAEAARRAEERGHGGRHPGGREERTRGPRHEAEGTRYRVAVGHTHGAQPGGIVGALTNEGGLSGKDLGKIDIFATFSLVDIRRPLDAETVERISRARVAGRPLRIAVDRGAPVSRRTPARRG